MDGPRLNTGQAHGQHGHRPPPAPDAIDEFHGAPRPDACPECAGPGEPAYHDLLEQLKASPHLSRAITDFAYCTYLSDLAVDSDTRTR